MSAVSDILEASTEVIVAGHGDDLVIRPGVDGEPVTVKGYAELVMPSTGQDRTTRRSGVPQHLSVGEVVVTHVVHIRRWELDQAGITDMAKVAEIGFGDRSYRVKDFVDDPATGSEVDFFCVLG